MFDLSAAFDTLDHQVFLRKLELYGVDKLGCQWFRSYLEGRRQFVEIKGHRSPYKSITCGSPQGAVCSPLIFTIYIADMPLWIKDSDLVGFADDTTSVVSRPNLSEACRVAEKDSERLITYMSTNGLVANASKTKLLVFRGDRDEESPVSISINRESIVESPCEKLLGLELSNDLCWNAHVKSVKTALNQRIAMLSHLAYSFSRDNLIQFTHGMIVSKIRYGIAVYGKTRTTDNCPQDRSMQSLEVAVNDAMRVIAGKRRQVNRFSSTLESARQHKLKWDWPLLPLAGRC